MLVLLVLGGVGSSFVRTHASQASDGGVEPSWLRSELYFGMGLIGRETAEADERWVRFLDEVVSPTFPAGFSYFPLFGQWQGSHQAEPVRLHSQKIIILHPDTPEDRDRVDSIRRAWIEQYHHESVLWSMTPAEVSF